MRWPDELSNSERYLRQLERLHARWMAKRRLDELTHEGVRLVEMLYDKKSIARMVARAVGGGDYRLSRAHVKIAMIDKPREIYSFEALDFLVHSVVAETLSEALESVYSPSLVSYRAGRSTWTVVRELAAWVRRHRRGVRDPRARGLYVLRADVRRYIETVPVDAISPLWPELLRLTGLPVDSPEWRLLEGVVRPEVIDDEEVHSMRRVGLATGSPTATVILNFYLHPLDVALDALGGGFYRRFGDDLVFADEDPDKVRRAMAAIDEVLEARRLSLNPKKVHLLHWNAAGRASASWPEARGAREVVFLGCGIRFDGTIVLPPVKWRELLSDLRQRLRRSQPLLTGEPLDKRGLALCAVVNEALDPDSELAHKHARLVRGIVTSREQLDELDYLIARAVVEALTSDASVRAFRKISRRRLREWGLRSMVDLRNRGR